MTRCSTRVFASFLAVLPALGLAQTSSAPSAAPVSAFVSLDSSLGIRSLDRRVTVVFDATPLRAAVAEVARIAGLTLTFDPSIAGLDRKVTVSFGGVAARDVLLNILLGSRIEARVSPGGQLVLVPRGGREAVIRGSVHASSGIPLAGARLDLLGTRFTTYTRDDGSFTIGRVPRGRYTLRAVHIGSAPATLDIAADSVTSGLELVLEPFAIPLDAIVVTPAYYSLMQATLGAPTALDRLQLETTPQLGDDVYRAMSRLPGVASDDMSAKFAVRGATGDELYVTLDGLQLIEPFHLKDIENALSIIDIRTLDRTELLAGGASAEFGDHTGGVLRMNTIPPHSGSARTEVGASFFNARAMADGGFASGKGGWLVSARRGYLDIALNLLNVTDSIDPSYHDLFAKVQYDVGRLGRLSLHGLRAHDVATFVDNFASMHSRYVTDYGWLRWQGTLGERLSHETIASVAASQWVRDGDGIGKVGTQDLLLVDHRSLARTAIRQDWSVLLSERALFRLGVEYADDRASYDYRSHVDHFVAEGDSVVRRIDALAVRLSPAGERIGAYVTGRIRPVASLTLEAGTRFDRATYSADRIWSPRVNASWDVRHGTTLRAAAGHHAQSQPLFALQVQNGDRTFGRADEAEQREIGVEQQLPASLSLRTQLYSRRMTNQRARWINAGPRMDLMWEMAYDRRQIQPGIGRARGFELVLARKRADHFEWSSAYTLARAIDEVLGASVPRRFDQRHAVQMDWALHPTSNRWRLTFGGLWHSGRPYTPDVVVVDTTIDTPQQFGIEATGAIGAINSARAPAYSRLDMRWTRYVDLRGGQHLMIFAEVNNLLDRKNVRGYTTSLDVRNRELIFRPTARESFGRLPGIGFTWQF